MVDIPVFAPQLGSIDISNAVYALSTGDISGTSGTYISEFERRFAEYCGVRHGVAVSSGTSALHLACIVMGIQPGDEVAVSALTNIATANAVVQCGGIVIPIDSERDTWNMDANLLAERITPRTKAIIPVHIYGHPVDMGAVNEIASVNGSLVIEDAAEAHGAEYYGAKTGSLGDVGCFSFYANKIITTGEGGMLTTNHDDIARRARLLRNLAFTTPRFLHHEVGFNYRMTNLQAAIGCGQMTRIDEIVEMKRRLAQRYIERLSNVPGLRLPVELSWARNVYWMFSLVVEKGFGCSRDHLMDRLLMAGIETRTMFCPLNLQPVLIHRGIVKHLPCPVAAELWERGLYLPSDPYLTNSDLDRICDIIRDSA